MINTRDDTVRQDFWGETQYIRQADIGSVPDVALRYAVVTGAALALFAASGQMHYLIWWVCYVVTNLIYSLSLYRTTGPVSFRKYMTLFAMNVVTSSIYSLLPIYMWLTLDDPAFKTLAICGIIGHGMFNLARHARLTLVALWDTFAILVSIAIVGVSLILETDDLAGQICIGFGCAAIMLYYAMGQHGITVDRAALAASRAEALEAQKLTAMGQITAGVAHDFNNKLTVIQGNIDLAALSPDPTQRMERLAEARAATEDAAEVVANMRAFVRKSPLHLETIQMGPFAARLEDDLRRLTPDSVALTVSCDTQGLKLTTDVALLTSALTNLSMNACEAMMESGGSLEVHIRAGNPEDWLGRAPLSAGPYVRFDVRDTGPGLPETKFRRALEPFFSTKPPGTGTGLGLSMVKGFTEQLGGALAMINRPVGGLEVSMLLPVTPMEDDA